MAYITVGSTFTPFSYDEKVRPFIQYNEAFDALEDKYLTMQEKAAQVGSLIDPETAPEAYRIYQNYQNSIQRAFDDLYANGITSNNKNMLGRIRNEQVPELTALTSDIARSEKAKEAFYKSWYGKEHDFIGRSPYDISLDEWLGGKTPETTGFSSLELSKYVAAGIKAISDRAHTIFEDSGYLIDQKGVSENQVRKIIEALESNSRFEDNTLEGKYLNMVLDSTKEFLYNDVFPKYKMVDNVGSYTTNSFYAKHKNKLDSAIGTGLVTGYGYSSSKSKIKTGSDDDGGGGGGNNPDPTAGLNAMPGYSFPSVQGDQAKTVNAMTRVANAEYAPLELSDGTIVQDPVEAYNILIPKLDEEFDNLEIQRLRSTNTRNPKYKAIVSRQNAIIEDKKALKKHFKDSKKDIKVINKKTGNQIQSIEDVQEIQESSYNNRITNIPSYELVGPSLTDNLLSVIAARMFRGIDKKTNVYEMDNYTQGKAVKSDDIEEIFGDAGANVGSIQVSVKTLYDDPENPYVMVNVDKGKKKGWYKVPLYTILGSQHLVDVFMSDVKNKLTDADISEIESWAVSDDDRSTDLEANITHALGRIRNLFSTDYQTTSSSKSTRI